MGRKEALSHDLAVMGRQSITYALYSLKAKAEREREQKHLLF